MSDNLDMTPHLTLTPEADAAAAAAPAAPEAFDPRCRARPPGRAVHVIPKGAAGEKCGFLRLRD